MARDPFTQPFDGGTVAGATTVTTNGDPWTMPLGSGAVYAAITNPGWDPANGNHWIGVKEAFHQASPSDPTRKVWRDNGVQHTTVQVSDSADMASGFGNDWPFVVAQASGDTFAEGFRVHRYDQWASSTGGSIAGAVANDLVLVMLNGQYLWAPGRNLKGFAWPSLGFSYSGVGRASRTTRLGGGIRPGELTTSYGIKHALAVAVAQSMLSYNIPGGGSSSKFWVWPAAGGDGFLNMSATGNVFYGSRLALLTSVDLTTFAAAQAALGLETTQALEAARAAQDFGIYIVDTTGTGKDSMVFGGGIPLIVDNELGGWGSGTLTAWRSDMKRILANCRAITNNYSAVDGGAPAGNIPGGSTGTLRSVVLASFDATPIPAAPTTLALGSPTTNSLTATWDASGVSGETGFDIQYRTVPGSYPGSPQITTIAAGAATHVIAGLTAGDYAAQVRSKNASGESAWSNEATGTVPAPPTVPAAPSGATGTAVDYRTIDWSWTDNSDNETGFKVYVQKTPPGGPAGAFVLITTTAAGATTYRQVDATPGSGSNNYVLRVYATNATGDSATYSESAPVTTPSPPTPGGGQQPGQTPAIYPASAVFPDAGSKVFPRTQDVKFPS